mgnify:CR=1 FL=1
MSGTVVLQPPVVYRKRLLWLDEFRILHEVRNFEPRPGNGKRKDFDLFSRISKSVSRIKKPICDKISRIIKWDNRFINLRMLFPKTFD